MKAIFLANDRATFLERQVAHIHITVTNDEEDERTFYEPTFFFLAEGTLTLVTSPWAEKNIGEFLGVVEDNEDPSILNLSGCPTDAIRH